MRQFISGLVTNQNNNYNYNVIANNDNKNKKTTEEHPQEEDDEDRDDNILEPKITNNEKDLKSPKTTKAKKLDVPPLLVQGLLNIQTRFMNGVIVTEEELNNLTLLQFDRMIVPDDELESSDDNNNNHNNNNNNNNGVHLNKKEMKMWKNVKRMARNRRSAASSRITRRNGVDKLEEELNENKRCIAKIMSDLSVIVAAKEYYLNNNDNLASLFVALQRITWNYR